MVSFRPAPTTVMPADEGQAVKGLLSLGMEAKGAAGVLG